MTSSLMPSCLNENILSSQSNATESLQNHHFQSASIQPAPITQQLQSNLNDGYNKSSLLTPTIHHNYNHHHHNFHQQSQLRSTSTTSSTSSSSSNRSSPSLNFFTENKQHQSQNTGGQQLLNYDPFYHRDFSNQNYSINNNSTKVNTINTNSTSNSTSVLNHTVSANSSLFHDTLNENCVQMNNTKVSSSVNISSNNIDDHSNQLLSQNQVSNDQTLNQNVNLNGTNTQPTFFESFKKVKKEMSNKSKVKKTAIKQNLIFNETIGPNFISTSNLSINSKRKKLKDPNEPQKPVSPYALFFRDTQSTIKLSNPHATFGEISKIVASMWESLNPELKEDYKKRTAHAKKDYLKQLAAYRATQVSQQQQQQQNNDSFKLVNDELDAQNQRLKKIKQQKTMKNCVKHKNADTSLPNVTNQSSSPHSASNSSTASSSSSTSSSSSLSVSSSSSISSSSANSSTNNYSSYQTPYTSQSQFAQPYPSTYSSQYSTYMQPQAQAQANLHQANNNDNNEYNTYNSNLYHQNRAYDTYQIHQQPLDVQTYPYGSQQISTNNDYGYSHEFNFQSQQQPQHQIPSHGYENNYFTMNTEENSGAQKLGFMTEYNNDNFLLNSSSAAINEMNSYGSLQTSTTLNSSNHSQQRWYGNQAYSYDSFNMN